MSDTTVAADPARRPAPDPERNPLRDVVERMDRAREHIGKADPQLSDTIKLLAERADRPGIMENPVYRGRVAYALLDPRVRPASPGPKTSGKPSAPTEPPVPAAVVPGALTTAKA